MKLGGRAVSTLAIVLVIVLVASSLGIVYFAYKESMSGGFYEKWSSTDDPDMFGLWLYYISNGTIIGSAQSWAPSGGLFHNFLFAMDLNGSLLWKAGVNTRFFPTHLPDEVNGPPYPILGPDGRIYYVDYLDDSIEEENGSLAQGSMITVLNRDGTVAWDSDVKNGSLSILSIYPDGVVMASHQTQYYDTGNSTWVGGPEDLIALSNNGTELWRTELPLQHAHSFAGPHIALDGSFVVTAYNDTEAFDVAFNKSTGSSSISQDDYHHYIHSGDTNKDGTVQYQSRMEGVNDSTTVISAYAINTSDGEILWHTVLKYADNPQHWTSDGYSSMDAKIDDEGVVLYGDFDGKSVYALDQDGNILWQKDERWDGFYSYPSGGFLLTDGKNILTKINSDGTLAWQYHAADALFGPVLVGEDGTIYYSTMTAIVAIASSR